MNIPETCLKTPARQPAFWDKMARSYPMPFDPKTLAGTRRVLDMARRHGVRTARASILDVGCGTGTYCLPLALEAASVTALDDSGTMLERLMNAAKDAEITNVTPVNASWKGIDTAGLGLEESFDVVFAAMTPAVQTLEDFMAMERCSTSWCVYIGWGRKRENPLMQEIFDLHGLPFKPPPGVLSALKILKAAGRNPSLDFFETSWHWSGSIAEAGEYMAGFIDLQGGDPDHGLIEGVLAHHACEGIISHTTRVEEGLLAWQKEDSREL